jgi:hypothetical protein
MMNIGMTYDMGDYTNNISATNPAELFEPAQHVWLQVLDKIQAICMFR